MANSLGTLSGIIVAQRTLEFLKIMFPALTKISSKFTSDQLLFNQQLICRVPVAMTAAAVVAATGYPINNNAQTVDVPITMDQHDHVSFGFNDQEVSSTNRNLIDEQALPAAFALGSKMFNFVFALITPGNIKHENVIADADWSRVDVIAQNRYLNLRGVSPLGRFGIVNSNIFAELSGDITIVGNQNNPASDTIVSGRLTNVHGVDVMEWPGMPTTNNLSAIFGTNQALAIATGVPKDPAAVNPGVPIPGKIDLVSDADTGLTLMVREWYDMRLGFHQVTLTWMYGAALGLPLTLERVVTTATGAGGTIVDV
jgi:hypothetical protein